MVNWVNIFNVVGSTGLMKGCSYGLPAMFDQGDNDVAKILILTSGFALTGIFPTPYSLVQN